MKNTIVTDYIKAHLMECTRIHYEDEDTFIGLPYPYSVPCPDHFQELYYWDTYFINLALIETGNLDQALNNVNDLLYLVKKYGFVPNASRTYYLDRSQPPFLSLMIKDIYDHIRDKEWLKMATEMLIIEHQFWMTKRLTSCGLNQYGSEIPESTWEKRFEIMQKRTALSFSIEKKHSIARTSHANVESGWDCTPRFEFDAEHYVQVDLNSLLFALESNIAYFALIMNDQALTSKFTLYAKRRTALMNKYLWSEDQGVYLDYNYYTNKYSPVFSAASFYPLFVSMADSHQAEQTIHNLPRLEYPNGISACEKNNITGRFQWDYPNLWAPLQYIVVNGLNNYGQFSAAYRIAEKYIYTVDHCFNETFRIWEKYNAVDGSTNVVSEKDTQMPVMLGWSAGVYIWFMANIVNKKENANEQIY